MKIKDVYKHFILDGFDLPTKKVKVDFMDEEGTKHSISIDGYITREKIAKILDYVELMGGAPRTSTLNEISSPKNLFERIQDIIRSYLPDKMFISKDIRELYKEIYGDSMNLSTISTYLSRLVDRGILIRSGSSYEWRYVLKSSMIR